MRLRIALVAAAVSLALPAVASAETFCVNKSPCLFGSSKSTVQGALDAAEQNPGLDVVRIGASSDPYQGPFSYDPSVYNPVEVVGDGIGETVLAASSPAPALHLGGAGSKVSGATFVVQPPVQDGSLSIGLELDGADASSVSVLYTGEVFGAIGVLTTDDADIRNLVVDMTAGRAVKADGGPQGTTIRDALLRSRFGVDAVNGATATLRDVRIKATSAGANAYSGGHLRLSNVLITTQRPGGSGLGLSTNDGGTITANHVTVADLNEPSTGKGVDVYGGSVSLRNTIVHGYGTPIARRYLAGDTTDLDVRYTNVDLASSALNQDTVPGTIVLGPGIRNDDPHFAWKGDFHLRGDSPLIDVGEFTPLSAETDIEGLDRDKDGDGDTSDEVDLGAFEYQRGAPIAVFTAGTATVGSPVAFDATPSQDPDPGDEGGFDYSWSFGDGSSGSGVAPEHVYSQPGDYTVGLTITDPSGLSALKTRVVSVAPAPEGGGGGAAPGTGTSADTLAPVISRLRVAPARRRVRFRLSEPARVTLRITSARSGKRRAVLRLSSHAGLNRVRLPRTVRLGSYRLTALARDAAGNSAQPKRTRFALLP
jgi:hypothetical protein